MRKVIMAGIILGISGIANANWYEKNPDHCPSIGFNLDGASGAGTQKVKSSGLVAEQDFTSAALGIFADAKIPISDTLSINGGVGISGYGSSIDETRLLTGSETSEGIFHFNVGIRIYLH